MSQILNIGSSAKFFRVGDSITLWACAVPANNGTSIVVRVIDETSVELLPATWRRRFAAWVWQKWGQR
jgi:hypothetical protein